MKRRLFKIQLDMCCYGAAFVLEQRDSIIQSQILMSRRQLDRILMFKT